MEYIRDRPCNNYTEIYDVAVYCSGGLLISAVMLTGGTSKNGPPAPPQQLAPSVGAERFCGSSRNALFLAAPPAVTVISGLALGVRVQSLTPTVTCSTAVWSTLTASLHAACSCCCITAQVADWFFSGSLRVAVSTRAVIATDRRPAAPSSRLTASKTRATRSGRSYGNRTTGNTGLGIKRRRHTNGDGRDSRCTCWCRPSRCRLCDRRRAISADAGAPAGDWSGTLLRCVAFGTTAGRRCKSRRRRRCRWTSSTDACSARPAEGDNGAAVVDEIANTKRLVRSAYFAVTEEVTEVPN